MSDIVERAKAALAEWAGFEDVIERRAELVPELVAEIEQLRRKVRYLDLTITEEVGHLSADERAELDALYSEVGH